jgi:hypothetical protein
VADERFHLKKGDRLPKIKGTIVDGEGLVVDLTGATVRFHMRAQLGAAALKVDAPATVVSAVAGTVEYAWASADTDTPGDFNAEWVVSFGSSDRTHPNDGHIHVHIQDRV